MGSFSTDRARLRLAVVDGGVSRVAVLKCGAKAGSRSRARWSPELTQSGVKSLPTEMYQSRVPRKGQRFSMAHTSRETRFAAVKAALRVRCCVS